MIDPAGHRVLVKVDEFETVTKGGIIVPTQVQEKLTFESVYGTLVAVGANAWKAFDDGHPWAVVGDKVLFAKHGGFNAEDPVTKEQFRILNDEDIVAVIR